ncbi:diacylglycerol/lipid kinase family protein [Methylocystis parvus]|uniref:diacylglycerol/lipid kinase family protein n=1 Tax=Methylocystis parvus TaxID=134 RepID=UPI0002FFC959|nr:diacylglycerol kinase family protein [Methylocystis parvus]WBJ99756.1 diacylglycerol kinase family lipid kinase [Methylocystis parvus OBBP]
MFSQSGLTTKDAAGLAPADDFVIVVNPDAGGERRRLAEAVTAALAARGRRVVVETAIHRGHIRQTAESVRAGALLVAGGDGSVNEAVRGLLARPGPRPKLGVVPQGTVNVLAQELRLPKDGAALAEIFLRGATKPLYVGLANGRPFTLMASAGLDAEVVKTVDIGRKRLKRHLGRLAYALAAAKIFARGGFPDIEAETDAGALRAKCVVVAKSRYYGGNYVIDASADVTRPGLSLVALTEVSPRAALALFRYVATGRLDEAGCVKRLAIRKATLRGAGAAQIDGDYLGPAPVEICEAEETLDVFAA